MPQNSSLNKLSSFIGITLLIVVIGFTVFINFETKKEVLEEEIHSEPFSEDDLANFWKLEKVTTEIVDINYGEGITYVSINKIQGILDYNSLIDTDDELSDSTREYTKESDSDISKKQFNLRGTLALEHTNQNNKYYNNFKSFEISYFDTMESDSAQLVEIGKLFVDYQIQSVTSEITYGDFTFIHLQDGRRIFLIQKGVQIGNNNYYEELLEESEYLNDSTRITYQEN